MQCRQKQKHPLKYIFWSKQKNHHNFFYIFLRGWCLYICQNLDFKGVISLLLNKKGLNKDIDFAAETKKNSQNAILDKTKTSHQILLESSESDVFGFFNVWLLMGVLFFLYQKTNHN